MDLIAVLHWSTDASLPAAIARLRSRAGETTVDAILDWVADSSGEAAPFVAALLRTGTVNDLVPLGVAVDCLLNARDRHEAARRLARLQHRWARYPASHSPRPAGLAHGKLSGSLGASSTARTGAALLAQRADELLNAAQAQHLTDAWPPCWRSGLTHRLRGLAEALRHGADGDTSALESAWARVAEHELVDGDARVAPARAGVRLVRWLTATSDDESPTALAALADRHLLVDAWGGLGGQRRRGGGGRSRTRLGARGCAARRRVPSRRPMPRPEFATALAREGCGDFRPPGCAAWSRCCPTSSRRW